MAHSARRLLVAKDRLSRSMTVYKPTASCQKVKARFGNKKPGLSYIKRSPACLKLGTFSVILRKPGQEVL